MSKKPEIISISCLTELSTREWGILQELDFLEEVLPALARVGGWGINYREHFGRRLFFEATNVEMAQDIYSALQTLLHGGDL